MSRLTTQNPCCNKEEALPVTLQALPQNLSRGDILEWLILDDESSDRTVEVPKTSCVIHRAELPTHFGNLRAFVTGFELAFCAGADSIGNTEAIDQSRSKNGIRLVTRVLEGRAEIVIGTRSCDQIEHLATTRKILQSLGRVMLRLVCRSDIL